jgi:hypothetical protein
VCIKKKNGKMWLDPCVAPKRCTSLNLCITCLLTRCWGAQTHMKFIYIVQVSYHVLSNAEWRFGHAVSQALSHLSVKAQVRSQSSPCKIGILTDWHLKGFFWLHWFAVVSIIPPKLDTTISLLDHWCYVILEVHGVLK